MTKVLSIFLFFLFCGIAFCQEAVNYKGFDAASNDSTNASLYGDWRISELVRYEKTTEYILTPMPDVAEISSAEEIEVYQKLRYGDHIFFDSTGKFSCNQHKFCGNDCFISTYGKYKIINESYLCFFLESIEKSMECTGKTSPNTDLGLFRIYRENGQVILRKSDGNPEQDTKNTEYIKLMEAKRKEIEQYKDYQPVLNWSKTAGLESPKQIAAFCMSKNKIADYELLYERNNLILVKIGKKHRYIAYENKLDGEQKVALFNDDFFYKCDHLVANIEASIQTPHTRYIPYDCNNPSGLDSVTVQRVGGEVVKVIYTQCKPEGKWYRYTYYLAENLVNVVKMETSQGVVFSFYVPDPVNLPNEAIAKPMITTWPFSGIMKNYNDLIPVVEKQQK